MIQLFNNSILYLGDLAKSIRANTDLHFGVYHSLGEWFNPVFQQDMANNYETQEFVKVKQHNIS